MKRRPDQDLTRARAFAARAYGEGNLGDYSATTPLLVALRERVVSVADRVHRRGDVDARAAGLTVARHGLTGRVYRSPLFDTLGGAR